ncbi:hypothetical protein Vafri_14510 [Volvox africanus]|uniref:Uncharacterized protein n=1 Tax=Volvox africanus TaxID=51714 RepID=A0A8J4BFW6_9CHLO|nr:hypothetical protein Vafri_14510 [Volvox africanus]
MSRHNGSLVSGWNGWRFETHEPLYEAEDEGRMTERRRLLTIAMDWYTVAQCSGALPRRDDLNSSLWEVGAPFFKLATQQGITLYEPLGGVCTILEACLRNGCK